MDNSHKNPYETLISELPIGGKTYRYFDLAKLNDDRVKQLPVSIKVLLECAIRNCDGFSIAQKDVEHILDWEKASTQNVNIFLI